MIKFDPETIAQYVDENLYEGHSGFTLPPDLCVPAPITEGYLEGVQVDIMTAGNVLTIINRKLGTKIRVELAKPISLEQLNAFTMERPTNMPKQELGVSSNPAIIRHAR
jgi:hypothetical protein